jgi:DNA-binding MarR family transcriptional regulator
MQLHTKFHAKASEFVYVSPMIAKLEPPVIEAWDSLIRAERTLLDKVQDQLKQAGLPPLDWYLVLHEIDASPKGMVRQAGVQGRTQLAQYNLCRLVDRLEREGLVERHQCQLDGRNNVLVITAKGRSLRRAMWPIYAEAIEEHFGARLSHAEMAQLAALLNKVLVPERN